MKKWKTREMDPGITANEIRRSCRLLPSQNNAEKIDKVLLNVPDAKIKRRCRLTLSFGVHSDWLWFRDIVISPVRNPPGEKESGLHEQVYHFTSFLITYTSECDG